MNRAGFIARSASVSLVRMHQSFPLIAITGPRKAGKTTLVRRAFPDKPYVPLEDPDQLAFARNDPKRFLERYPNGAILDDVQRCPDIFLYLQDIINRRQVLGEFILVGSLQFSFRQHVAESFGEKMITLHLLPFTSEELRGHGVSAHSLDREMFRGFYPPVHDRLVLPADWYAGYVQAYVERDVLQMLLLKGGNDFLHFLKLCAGRVGQVLNLSSIGNDAGVSHNTIKEWLSVLEASYIIYRLSPHHKNFSKRLIRSPKLYFFDTGLLCWLLGIRSSEQLATHALRGVIFKNYVIAELSKQYYSNGEVPPFYFWRDQSGLEIDLIVERAGKLQPVEIKSGQTLTEDYFNDLNRWMILAGKEGCDPTLVFGGQEQLKRSGVHVLGWKHLGSC